MSDYQTTSMMKALPFSFEEVSIDRDNVITLEGNGSVQANDLLGLFQVIVDEEEDLKCVAKVNLDKNRALYEVIFKNQSIKSKIKALIEPEVNCSGQICKIVENRDVKTTKKVPLTTVIIYEAPYELEDHHVYKVRYDGQNRKPICSHCKATGHYYKDCEEYARAIEERDKRIEQAELEELEEARLRKEETDRRDEEKRLERERILNELEEDRNQRRAESAWDSLVQNRINNRITQESMESEQSTNKQDEQDNNEQIQTQENMTTEKEKETSQEVEFSSQPPANQMAYAEATKRQLTTKEKKERQQKQKQLNETRKNEKSQQLENLSKIQIAKILNGKKETEIRGRDKELIKELRKKMKKNREEIMKEHGMDTNDT